MSTFMVGHQTIVFHWYQYPQWAQLKWNHQLLPKPKYPKNQRKELKVHHACHLLNLRNRSTQDRDGRKRFSVMLSKVALLVLTIPHSNAGEERVFSMIKKNLTSLRSCLDQEETLGSIMTIKMESLNSPEGINLPPNVRKAAKSATRLYNKAHS